MTVLSYLLLRKALEVVYNIPYYNIPFDTKQAAAFSSLPRHNTYIFTMDQTRLHLDNLSVNTELDQLEVYDITDDDNDDNSEETDDSLRRSISPESVDETYLGSGGTSSAEDTSSRMS